MNTVYTKESVVAKLQEMRKVVVEKHDALEAEAKLVKETGTLNMPVFDTVVEKLDEIDWNIVDRYGYSEGIFSLVYDILDDNCDLNDVITDEDVNIINDIANENK